MVVPHESRLRQVPTPPRYQPSDSRISRSLPPPRSSAVTSAAWAYSVSPYEVEPGASSAVPTRVPLTNAS